MRAADLRAIPVAFVELALARLRLDFLASSDLGTHVDLGISPKKSTAERLPAEVARVAFLIPRVAARLPWRADCLVQALAARHWLARLGYRTTLSIGSRRGPDGQFLAHAWLEWEGLAVTGGDVSEYEPFRAIQPAGRD